MRRERFAGWIGIRRGPAGDESPDFGLLAMSAVNVQQLIVVAEVEHPRFAQRYPVVAIRPCTVELEPYQQPGGPR